MELDHPSSSGVFRTHYGVGQPLGRKGLSYSGRAGQNDVLLAFEESCQPIIIALRKIYLVEKVILVVRGDRFNRRLWFLVILVEKQFFETVHISGVRSDVREGLRRGVLRVLPFADVSPLD